MMRVKDRSGCRAIKIKDRGSDNKAAVLCFHRGFFRREFFAEMIFNEDFRMEFFAEMFFTGAFLPGALFSVLGLHV